jgi:hypothetical protein
MTHAAGAIAHYDAALKPDAHYLRNFMTSTRLPYETDGDPGDRVARRRARPVGRHHQTAAIVRSLDRRLRYMRQIIFVERGILHPQSMPAL